MDTRRMGRMRIELLPAGSADPNASSAAYQTCIEIRRKVFVEGQAVPAQIEFDGLDEDAKHFLAFGEVEELGAALGTARLRIVDGTAKAERIAVLEHARGSGIGRALVEAIESHARGLGVQSIRLNAQVQAALFYEKLGYLSEGDVFIEAGIDHRAMGKSLF